MKVGFGCDHTAIDLKKELMEYMTEKGYECVDYGAYDAKVRVDYPDQGQKVAEAIIAGEVEKGVLICGTGIGISLAANKVPGWPDGKIIPEDYNRYKYPSPQFCLLVHPTPAVPAHWLSTDSADTFRFPFCIRACYLPVLQKHL